VAVDHGWLGQSAFSLSRNTPVTHAMLWMTVLGVIIATACGTHLKWNPPMRPGQRVRAEG
jgi:hypothetical protein